MRFLVIQTAFLGDVVLATPVVEQLHRFYPDASIDFLLRKGNESLLQGHPYINEVLIWNKKEHKLRNLWQIMRLVRSRHYDYVINLQRYASSGFITAFAGTYTIGFDKNPLSFLFTERKHHHIGTSPADTEHEVNRNLSLVAALTDNSPIRPRLYPCRSDMEKVKPFQQSKYLTMSPASVWFTKQFPAEKWVELLKTIDPAYTIYLLGAPGDKALCDTIIAASGHAGAQNLCGNFSLLQSAALMKGAEMNYVNDSAPMHLASSMNAPVTAIYCSTVPYFGFGPLSDRSYIAEIQEPLSCRPCGLHGYKKCPEGHFRCALDIPVSILQAPLNDN